MRAVWVWLALLAVGIAAFLYGGTMDVREPMAMPLVYAGGALIALALVMLLVTWRGSRRQAYAQAVEATDAIARWQVYPSDMAAFRQIDAARAGRLWSLKNSLKFPDQVPPEGFPVVVGETSLLVGDRLYSRGLEEFGAPGEILLQDGQPGFIEISFYIETTKAPVIAVLRIPVPAAARQEAERAAAHLESQVKPRDRERLHSTFGDHFEAVGQATDAPHRMQRRRKVLIPVLALFFLGMAAFLLYSIVLRPSTSRVPTETFPALPEAAPDSDAAYPPLANEAAPLPANETVPRDEP